MSIKNDYDNLNEDEKYKFLEAIAETNIKSLIKLVNKHYSKDRTISMRKRYHEDPEFRKKFLAQKKILYQKKKKLEQQKIANEEKSEIENEN